MNKPNMKCRVCGKEYFCCSDSKDIGSWRTMACSIDCYKEYMHRIEESRKPKIDVVVPLNKENSFDETEKVVTKKTAKQKIKIENDED